MIVVGVVLLSVAAVWYRRTARVRRLWQQSRQDMGKLAIILELEDRMRDLGAGPPGRRA